MTRGIRNNNPANIRHSSSKWRGMSKNQTDSAFVQFDHITDGIRALFVLLRTYNKKYKCTTTESVIRRFAPPSENMTSSYIKFVNKQVFNNESSTQQSNVWVGKNPSLVTIRLAKAICWIESQYMPSDEEIAFVLKCL